MSTYDHDKTRILVVDDDCEMRECFCALLTSHADEVVAASNLATARVAIAEHAPDVVLLDHRLPDGTGMELLAELKQGVPDAQVIFITGHAAVDFAVDVMHRGAFFFLEKPCNAERLRSLVTRALARHRVLREARARLAAHDALEPALIADSLAMREVQAVVRRYAQSPSSTVLITGESGVGKDVVARALHAQSPRAGAPFVTITCSAIPDTLLESELFGHERGAFTDAKMRRMGLFEQARDGTVFLDEIGELPLTLQAKLLRFLEQRVFRRLGGTHDIHADVRIIAATHRDIHEEVVAGRFRSDLYYRLSVLNISIPPLRDRRSDIAALAEYFVDCFNRTLRKQVTSITSEALELLQAQHWPGNARELRNVIERAMVLSNGPVLDAACLRLERPNASTPRYALPPDGVDLVSVERELVQQALQRASGNQTQAAKLLRISRDQMRYRIEKFHLEQQSRSSIPT